MSEDPGSGVKKPMEPSSLLEVILIFIGSLLLKAIEYLSAFTHTSHKSLTPPKNLSDLPADVVSLIVERLDYKEQLLLRKVSKCLRSLVDKLKPACKSIIFVCTEEQVVMGMNDHFVMYRNDADGDDSYLYDDFHGIIVIREDFKKAVFDDLASNLKHPKLKLDEFRVEFDACDEEDIMTYYNNLQCILESLSHQLSVKKVVLELLSPSNLLSILPYLKPGFLDNISIWLHDVTREINWRIDSTEMDQVALLDQWKQAIELKL